MCKCFSLRKHTIFLILALFFSGGCLCGTASANDDEPLCIYVSSYHKGFEWSDRVESGLRTSLSNSCRIIQFDMDSKRHQDPAEIEAAARGAYELIKSEHPDVVITSDDNAARYLIVPYLLDSDIPVVFSGINWTVEEYGFPAENVTGIVEVAPLGPLIGAALQAVPGASRVAYFSANTLTEAKNFERYSHVAKENGLYIDQFQAASMDEWIDAFQDAQNYDFAIIGGVAGISDWDEARALKYVKANTRTFVVTTHEWLMPYASLGITMVPEEHGEWAAGAAKAVLNGTAVGSIPIVTNRKWDTWINNALVEASGATVSKAFMRSAKQVGHAGN